MRDRSDLRSELVLAGHRRNELRARRTRSRRVVVGAASAFAAVIFGLVVFVAVGDQSPAGASVVVERVGDRWHVTLTDSEPSIEMIEDELRAAGIEAEVTAVPVGPSRIGQFVGGDHHVRLVGNADVSSSLVEIPVDAPSVRLRVGRPAAGDEPYEAFSDAFASGEPIECSGVWGTDSVEVVQARIDDVTVVGEDGGAPPSNGVVADVRMLSPARALVFVADSPPADAPDLGSDRCPVG